jgi:hypothetical protein
MDKNDADRLAQIRRQSELWIAMKPEAWHWDTPYLLRELDAAKAEANLWRVLFEEYERLVNRQGG